MPGPIIVSVRRTEEEGEPSEQPPARAPAEIELTPLEQSIAEEMKSRGESLSPEIEAALERQDAKGRAEQARRKAKEEKEAHQAAEAEKKAREDKAAQEKQDAEKEKARRLAEEQDNDQTQEANAESGDKKPAESQAKPVLQQPQKQEKQAQPAEVETLREPVKIVEIEAPRQDDAPQLKVVARPTSQLPAKQLQPETETKKQGEAAAVVAKSRPKIIEKSVRQVILPKKTSVQKVREDLVNEIRQQTARDVLPTAKKVGVPATVAALPIEPEEKLTPEMEKKKLVDEALKKYEQRESQKSFVKRLLSKFGL